MIDDSLKDSVRSFNDSKLKEKIENKYYDQLKNQMLMNEPLGDLKEVSTSHRKYDYGPASDTTVNESGIKIVFNSDETKIEDVQDGGRIQKELYDLIKKYPPSCEVRNIELSFVKEDSYIIWILYDL